MKPLYDSASVTATLRKGVEKGYWTIQDLDTPPAGYAGKHESYRNLLRDDKPTESVEAGPSPRDFAEQQNTHIEF